MLTGTGLQVGCGGMDWIDLAQDRDSCRAAYFHFIHAFGNGRRSYASEPVAKRTVRCIRSAIDTTWTSCNHVMQSCCIAYWLVGELRQHLADCKCLEGETIKTCSKIIKWNAISKKLKGK